MNFYPFHIGDYTAHTAHLDDARDLAYRRLLDRYYLTEKPLPLDVESLAEKIRMPAQQHAVERVLREFFNHTAEGWRHDRADAEIAVMQQKQGAVEEREQHEQTRLQKHRERRALMFEALANKGVFPPYNVKINDLTALFKLHVSAPETPQKPPVSLEKVAPETAPETPETLLATAIARVIPTPTPTPTPTPINTNSRSFLSPQLPAPITGAADLLGDVIPDLDDGLPKCPTKDILRLWAELMPELQQPIRWTDARQAQLRQRWREEAKEHGWRTSEEGLRVFAKLFRWCRRSDFLMGKTDPRQGRQHFALTLPWLAKAENWAKVQEGNFHE